MAPRAWALCDTGAAPDPCERGHPKSGCPPSHEAWDLCVEGVAPNAASRLNLVQPVVGKPTSEALRQANRNADMVRHLCVLPARCSTVVVQRALCLCPVKNKGDTGTRVPFPFDSWPLCETTAGRKAERKAKRKAKRRRRGHVALGLTCVLPRSQLLA